MLKTVWRIGLLQKKYVKPGSVTLLAGEYKNYKKLTVAGFTKVLCNINA